MKFPLILATLASSLSLLLGASPVRASSYQTVFANPTIVDPIQSVLGGPHPYSGPNLEPFVGAAGEDLSFAVLDDANLFVADLRFVNLTGSYLDRANLDFALLIDGFLSGVRLVDASLSSANLSGADLTNAVVGRANLTNANLSGANLSGTNLSFSSLGDANLTDADLTGAVMAFANLSGATLEGALYDESTIFPSGDAYDSPPWELYGDETTPWDRGMIPTPEPSIAGMLVLGTGWIVGLAGSTRGAVSLSRGLCPSECTIASNDNLRADRVTSSA